MNLDNGEIYVNAILRPIIGPWYESLENPSKAQECVLQELLKKYALTEYGKGHYAREVSGIVDFKSRFPIMSYRDCLPFFSRVK